MTRAFFYPNLFAKIALNLTMPTLEMTPASASDHATMVPPRLGEGGRDGLIKAGFSRDEINQLATSGAAIFNDAEDF